MASLQIAKSSLSPFLSFRSDFGWKSSWFCTDSYFVATERKILKLQTRRSSKVLISRGFRVCSRLEEGENESNGEEPPESLFMKELRRRGMTHTSLLEESNRSTYGLDEEIKLKEDDRGFSKRNVVSTDKSLSNQRERSMALNSEGLEVNSWFTDHQRNGHVVKAFSCLEDNGWSPIKQRLKIYIVKDMTDEGLIPRAKLLLTLGGTFFLGFWPLILITVALFAALYFYFGPSFIHDASKTQIQPPPYIDPYTLLEDQRLSQTAPRD